MVFESISIYLFISILFISFFAAFIQSSAKDDYAKILFVLGLAITLYMFGYLEEITATLQKSKLFWHQFQYIGIPFISALWLTMALMYTDHFYKQFKIKLILIYAIPVCTFVLFFTNDFHHLYYHSIVLSTMDEYVTLMKIPGPAYVVQSIHSGIMILVALFVLIYTFIKRHDHDGEKILYMIFASGFACFGLSIDYVVPTKHNIDFMVLSLPISMIFVILAVLRNDFLEVKTKARELVFEDSSEGILLLSGKNRILDYNTALFSILESDNILLSKKNLSDVIPSSHQLSELLESPRAELWEREADDGIHYYEIFTTQIPQKNYSAAGTIKTFRDVTEIYLRTNRLKKQATTDDLSGLLNRRAFIHSCQSLMNTVAAPDQKFFLLMLDIDFFKQINDTYGHAAGDYVIRQFGKQVQQSFRTSDPLGRLGGEEFGVFMKATGIDVVLTKAESFREILASTEIDFENNIFAVTVSIGIAEVTKYDHINDMISKADRALYYSKHNGRNQVSIYDELQ